jgi:O-antigen ligase
LIDPFIGLLGVGTLCALDPLTRVFLLSGGLLRWNTFNYWLLLVVVVSPKLLLFRPALPVRILWLIAGLLIVQLFPSSDRLNGLQHIIGLLSFLGLYAYFYRAQRRMESWPVFALVIGLQGIIGGAVYEVLKSSLVYINPNAYVHFPLCALVTVSIAFPMAHGRRWVQWLLLGTAVLNGALVFLTASRGGMLLGIACAVYLGISLRRSVHRLVLIALAVAIVPLVVFLRPGEVEYAMQRVSKLGDSERTLSNRTSGRSEIVEVGWRIFLQNPLGIGTGEFSYAYARSGESGLAGLRQKQAHSGWIKTLAENGVPGVILLSLFVCSFAYIGLRGRNSSTVYLGFFLSFGLAVTFLATEFQGKTPWLLAAVGTCLLHERLKNTSSGHYRTRIWQVTRAKRGPLGCRNA